MRATARDSERRGLLGFARGVVRAVSARPGQAKLQHLDIEALAGETHDGAEHMEPYGLTARPHAGAEAVIAFAGGNRAHPLILAVADRKYRLQGLADGEVALYDDLGQTVRLTRSGIAITAPTITVNGDLTVNGAVTIAGASLTHNGKNVGASHVHGGVTPGGANTDVPT